MGASSDEVRNPRSDAQNLVGSSLAARVLEPSPPAVATEPWFADDPLASDETSAQLLLPVGVAEHRQSTSWSQWVQAHPEHQVWAADRWLAGDRSLPTAPASLTTTRLALHRLAAYVIAPASFQANGKFGLRWTLNGFGTPFFGDDRQIRVEGTTLVDQRGEHVQGAPITTLADAAAFLGTEIDATTAAEHDSPELGSVNTQLDVDPAACAFLGSWFGMAFAALEHVRADSKSIDASRPQLWPGHFDPAIEIGDEGHRGSYGASPGDHSIDEPYLYASVWWPDRLSLDSDDPFWNAPSFTGAILRLADFGDGDPATRAAEFFLEARDRIHA